VNLYTLLGYGVGTSEAAALSERLAMWHDAMVSHERRLRGSHAGDLCDEDCPHAEAPELWAKAVNMFGDRADELSFLRSRSHDRESECLRHVPNEQSQVRLVAGHRRGPLRVGAGRLFRMAGEVSAGDPE